MAKFTSTNLGNISSTTGGVALENSTDSFYFGDTTESGIWRIRTVNGNLVFEKYDGSIWNEKFTMDESGEPLLSLF